MKMIILLFALLPAALPAYGQSMRIYMTDNSQVTVNLADVDSITFSVSVTALDKNVSDSTCSSLEAGVVKEASALATEIAGGSQAFSADSLDYSRPYRMANTVPAGPALNNPDDHGGVVVQNSFTPLTQAAKPISMDARSYASTFALLSQARIE